MDETTSSPRVPQTAQRIATIKRRADRDLRERAEERFRTLVLAWATEDDGPLPTRAQAEDEVRAELEVLCRGLGRWAALDPDEVFPPRRWWAE